MKYQLINVEGETVLARGVCDRIGINGSFIRHKTCDGRSVIKEIVMESHLEAIKQLIAVLTDEETGVIKSLDEINAVGHRVVHGGEKFFSSVIIDDEVIKTIEECEELAPSITRRI